jgi:copper chaperone NosL
MSRKSETAGLIVLAALCGCHGVDNSRPPSVRFGEEACDSCRMIISDERFAAALVTEKGDALKFDDIGCLIQHESNQLRPDVSYWVRDYKGEGWLNAREAMFIRSANVVSPMGHGLAALPAGRSAEELFTSRPARPMRFSELPGFVADQARESTRNSPGTK